MGPMPKRRKLSNKVDTTSVEEEIIFDNEARREFLTGFHKRKLQRAKHAQEVAERRMKEEKREQKKRLREERQAELRRAFEEHQARMRVINGIAPSSEDEDEDEEEKEKEKEKLNSIQDGIGNEEANEFVDVEPEPVEVDHTAEYIDEDKYTTVTVEEIDPTKEDAFASSSDSEEEEEAKEEDVEDGDDGRDEEKKMKKKHNQNESLDQAIDATDAKNSSKHRKRIWSKDTAMVKPKKSKKKRNFKYERKEDRRVTRYKERTGNRKKAKERRGKR
ncbi:hypothetical protein KEM54_000428 [Ascosphaera aggregata]|nr:hypothetical protein KEM54_000428 [Ascosphaera aggregata]